jgi:hypothetical protein
VSIGETGVLPSQSHLTVGSFCYKTALISGLSLFLFLIISFSTPKEYSLLPTHQNTPPLSYHTISNNWIFRDHKLHSGFSYLPRISQIPTPRPLLKNSDHNNGLPLLLRPEQSVQNTIHTLNHLQLLNQTPSQLKLHLQIQQEQLVQPKSKETPLRHRHVADCGIR